MTNAPQPEPTTRDVPESAMRCAKKLCSRGAPDGIVENYARAIADETCLRELERIAEIAVDEPAKTGTMLKALAALEKSRGGK